MRGHVVARAHRGGRSGLLPFSGHDILLPERVPQLFKSLITKLSSAFPTKANSIFAPTRANITRANSN